MNIAVQIQERAFTPYELPEMLVVLGNYRQGEFIRDAILSIASQTYKRWHCVVVDDCSNDGSDEIINSVLDELNDDRFTFLCQKENGGQMKTMLAGLDASSCGEFVAFLDADDIWHEEYLATHLAFHLNSETITGVTSCKMLKVNADRTVVAGTTAIREKRPKPLPVVRNINFKDGHPLPQLDSTALRVVEGSYVTSLHLGWIWSATSGMVFRRDVLEATRPKHPELMPICADAYFAELAHFAYGTILIQQPLTSYRVHGNNNFCGNENKSTEKQEFLRQVGKRIWEAKLAWLDENRKLAKRFRRNREVREYHAFLISVTGKKSLKAWYYKQIRKLKRA